MGALATPKSRSVQSRLPRVSNFGRYANRWGRKCYPSPNPEGYIYVGIKYGPRSHQVATHRLVHVLFNDPQLQLYKIGNTVDHKDRCRSNNSSENLQWATPLEQSTNRKYERGSVANTGCRKRIELVHAETHSKSVFDSIGSAARFLRCQPRMRSVMSSAKAAGFGTAIVEDDDLPNEEWKCHVGVRVSTMGRITSDGKHKFFPVATKSGYVRYVVPNGKTYKMHNLVMEAFGVPRPFPEATVDHLNRCKCDNRLVNLAWKSKSDQAINRVAPLSNGSIGVEFRKVGNGVWVHCESAKAASETTGVSIDRVRQICKGHSSTVARSGYTFRFSEVGDQLDLPGEKWKDVVPYDWFDPKGIYNRL